MSQKAFIEAIGIFLIVFGLVGMYPSMDIVDKHSMGLAFCTFFGIILYGIAEEASKWK